jgi:predicted nucleotidyltransferase
MGIKKVTIADALFSKVKQRVLGILYSQPETPFFTNEIIRLTHSGTGAVQRELEKLTASGLLVLSQVGNQKRYQANANTPFFNELRSIVLKTFGLADFIEEALKPIAGDIFSAFIYGSIAKQEDTAKSDIDLMVIGDNLSYSHLFQVLAKAEEKLGRKINPTIYTLSDWKLKGSKDNHFIVKIKNQPKIFIIGTDVILDELN